MEWYRFCRYHISVCGEDFFLFIRSCCFVEHEEFSNCADHHDVDESMMTTANYGGRWDRTSGVGITMRDLFGYAPISHDVASSDIRN